MQHLCDDMAHLLDALGLEDAIFTGHDWGGFVVWQMPFCHPNRTKAVIGINTLLYRVEIDPIEIFKAIWESSYLVRFQEYGVAEKILDENPRKTLPHPIAHRREVILTAMKQLKICGKTLSY